MLNNVYVLTNFYRKKKAIQIYIALFANYFLDLAFNFFFKQIKLIGLLSGEAIV